MHISRLRLHHFRNHEKLDWSFVPKFNALLGPNGCGKTNVLDAIHTLCLTKGAGPLLEAENVRHGADFYLIMGEINESSGQLRKVKCQYQPPKKVFACDEVAYTKVSEHVGQFPCVAVWPGDTDLINGGSEGRRRFFDHAVAQMDKAYLQSLLQYNQLLRQRNKLLKQAAERNRLDHRLLETYDAPLLPLASGIAQTRQSMAEAVRAEFEPLYQQLSGRAELMEIQYISQALEADFAELFRQALPKDQILQRTTVGVHKDDYQFLMNDTPLKKFGSQGQQKTFLLALKLAQYLVVRQQSRNCPILLLDDVFDKLDDGRIAQLFDLIRQPQFGQIFLSDARPERTKTLLRNHQQEAALFELG